jgi:hypothetical protein
MTAQTGESIEYEGPEGFVRAVARDLFGSSAFGRVVRKSDLEARLVAEVVRMNIGGLSPGDGLHLVAWLEGRGRVSVMVLDLDGR